MGNLTRLIKSLMVKMMGVKILLKILKIQNPLAQTLILHQTPAVVVLAVILNQMKVKVLTKMTSSQVSIKILISVILQMIIIKIGIISGMLLSSNKDIPFRCRNITDTFNIMVSNEPVCEER